MDGPNHSKLIITMAEKKGQKGKASSGKKQHSNGSNGAVSVKSKSSSSSNFILSAALPGLILAIAAALWHRVGDSSNSSPNHVYSSYSSRELKSFKPGTWNDGYYTTEITQSTPSTHALLYPNGGIGEPEVISFASEEEFLNLGRLYNDLGQIVQSPVSRHSAGICFGIT